PPRAQGGRAVCGRCQADPRGRGPPHVLHSASRPAPPHVPPCVIPPRFERRLHFIDADRMERTPRRYGCRVVKPKRNWIQEERRKTLRDYTCFCLACGSVWRYFLE